MFLWTQGHRIVLRFLHVNCEETGDRLENDTLYMNGSACWSMLVGACRSSAVLLVQLHQESVGESP
jgi:hypothetical protein